MREAPLPSPTPQTRRLHISPFNPSLLPLVLPPSILQNTTSISYHTIQTFPERNYGYVTLPIADAEKITKKLNGWILKGSKMKVTEARPEKTKRKHEDVDDEEGPSGKKKLRKSKEGKSQREEGVLPGVELPKERKVKRGWTEVEEKEKKVKKEKKSKTKSSYTDEPELLFKTIIPPNALPVENGSSKKKKERKSKKSQTDREATVHEFANTTKQPAFLRDEQASEKVNSPSEYVDGKGWIDSNGEILEAEPPNVKAKNTSRRGRPKKAQPDETSIPTIAVSKTKPRTKAATHEDDTSSSGSSSPSSSASSSSPPPLDRLSITRSSATPPPVPLSRVTTTSPPASPPSSARQPHPFETIFKTPAPPTSTPTSHSKKPNLEVSTSFSFFDVDDPGAMTAGMRAPRTPATQMDIRNRRQRSAAPTPDTAMPGKSFWTNGQGRRSESVESGDVSDGGLPTLREAKAVKDYKAMGGTGEEAKGGKEREESAFAKDFYDKRGDSNRGAKKRVREVKKERRQKENKRRG